MENFPYGLTVSGRNTRVAYGGNEFGTKFGGAAITFSDGALDDDEGGNEFMGNGVKKNRVN